MSFENITLKGGAIVTADITNKSKCRGCHELVVWATTKNAKYMPIVKDENGDWISHFADCKKATLFRRENKYEEDRQKERDEWLDGRGI